MKTGSIKQTISFNATPDRVFNLIMDAKAHAEFSGSKVTMSRKVNGKFRVFGGYCHGYNIELIEPAKIVQGWHFAEEGWPEDHFSICTFLFIPRGSKTTLTFLQTNVPEHKVDALTNGWKEYYWGPMKTYLRK